MTPRAAALSGALTAAVAATGLALDLRAPWLRVRADGAWRDVLRQELLGRDPTGYEAWLLHSAPWAFAALVLAGLLLALSAAAAVARQVRGASLALAASAGAVLAVNGARWAGFALARALDAGPVGVRLHVVPWLHLGVGLGAAAWAVALLAHQGFPVSPWHADARRRPGLAAAWTAAAALLAGPLAPYARLEAGGATFHYDELTIAALAPSGGAIADAARALAGARAALWATIVLGAASAALAGSLRASAPLRWVPWLPVPGLAAAAAFGAWALGALAAVPADPRVGPNAIAVVAGLAGLAWVCWGALAGGRSRRKSGATG